jgi:hypothetical protein
MRGWRAALFSIVAATLVSSCSRPPILVLVNNAGHAVDIVFASYGGAENDVHNIRSFWERTFRLPVRVNQGHAREFTRMAQFAGSWTIRLRSRECLLSFDIPVVSGEAYLNEGWPRLPHDEIGPVDPTVQLEPDQSLHLVSLGARRAWDVATVRDLQPEGFPLAPTERECSPQAG